VQESRTEGGEPGWRIALAAAGWAADPALAELTALAAGTSRVRVQETVVPSAAVPGDSADRAHAAVVVVAHPASDLAEAAGEVLVEVVAGADRRTNSKEVANMQSIAKSNPFPRSVSIRCAAACLCASALLGAPQSGAKVDPPAVAAPAAGVKLFDTPQQAADELVNAAEKFDVVALTRIFGLEGEDIIFSGEFAQDRKHAVDFAREGRQKKSISLDPKTRARAFLLIGNDDWPFPVPLVLRGGKWSFDGKSGRQELIYRRIGANELDAIQICHGYVEAQSEYALQMRSVNDVNQYAQRIISTPGKQDGLAWQNADGTWAGPVGENIARAIEQGYSLNTDPYHGYFFKILKGQGPAAPLGEMDFVVKGVMIGGFALVAAPAEYGVTGVRSFIISHDGVVYEKDLGPKTLDEFQQMQRFNPDKSWTPVSENPE